MEAVECRVVVWRSASAFWFSGVSIVALVAACGGESMSSEDASGGTAGSNGGASGGTGGVTGGTGGVTGGTGGVTGGTGGVTAGTGGSTASGGASGTVGVTGGTGASGGSGGANGGTVGMTGGTGAVGGATAATGGISASGGSMSGAAGTSGSSGRCPDGVEVVIDRLCIRGTPMDGGEYVAEGTEFRIELYPQGCFSSSCTTILDASCTVTVSGSMDDELLVNGGICHAMSRVGDAVPCTDDCGGGGMAECPVEPLAAQRYFAIYEDLIVAVEVPSLVEPGGRCVSGVQPGPPPRDRWPAQSPEPPAP